MKKDILLVLLAATTLSAKEAVKLDTSKKASTKKKYLEAPTKNSVNNKTTNNLFVGSTADLQKMLKQIK